MNKMIKQRQKVAATALFQADLPQWLIQLYAMRGITSAAALDLSLKHLLPYDGLLNLDVAVSHLAEFVMKKQRILIIGDYDADGATSTSLAVLALKQMGASFVDFLVPDRFKHGYGLSEALVEEAVLKTPDLIITVDNGIANHKGVAAARAKGIAVMITDHHLSPETLPDANWIINPNQAGCSFASKNLAGVGVIFYVMLALRKQLAERGWFAACGITSPNMAQFLDLVALGTVADLVPMDFNNRILVEQGLRRIRAGQARPGINALIKVAKRDSTRLRASDFGFALGPRLNAAGRLEDMSIGIHCLLASTVEQARDLATQLNRLNDERKEIESTMQQQAFAALAQCQLKQSAVPTGICVYQADWHQGIIGILASRIKEQYHRPVIAFAPDKTGLKGSCRSLPGIHIRDILQRIDSEHPGMILKYGGHAMAAGLTLEASSYQQFSQIFSETIIKYTDASLLEPTIMTDGSLPQDALNLESALQLNYGGPWGQQFPEPLFDDVFYLLEQKIVGEKHLKMQVSLTPGGPVIDAICFFASLEAWPNQVCQQVKLVYRLDVNYFNVLSRLQLIVTQIEALSVAATVVEVV